jgi:CheY-like chemotaxis protein
LFKEKKKILVVEDNSETQLIIKVNLREHYDVQIRDNAVEAISLVNNNNFDLVLLDINLRGEFDGKEVLKKLKENISLHKIPVIIITAYDLAEEERNYLEKVCCDYIEKPLDKDKLLKSIRKCIRIAEVENKNQLN